MHYPDICAGFTDQEKKRKWGILKQPGVYEIPVFGDYVLYAIAKGCKKNILIFNTHANASDPIYVIRATEFGGSTDSNIPVVIAYNNYHYESLHPKSLEDIEKTISLVNSYSQGNYEFSKEDIPYLISIEDKVNYNNVIESNSNSFEKDSKRKRLNVREITIEERRKYKR